jgi:hypothetical protein
MWFCQATQPQREDYAYEYLKTWLLYDKNEYFLEGERVPVVPLLACSIAVNHPEDRRLQGMKKLIVKTYTGEKK